MLTGFGFFSKGKITEQRVFFQRENHGAESFFLWKKSRGKEFFKRKNHGAESFFEGKNHGALTFFSPQKIRLPGPGFNKFCSLPKYFFCLVLNPRNLFKRGHLDTPKWVLFFPSLKKILKLCILQGLEWVVFHSIYSPWSDKVLKFDKWWIEVPQAFWHPSSGGTPREQSECCIFFFWMTNFFGGRM